MKRAKRTYKKAYLKIKINSNIVCNTLEMGTIITRHWQARS